MKVAFLRALFWDWFQFTPQSSPTGASPGDATCMWTLTGPLDYLVRGYTPSPPPPLCAGAAHTLL